MPQEFMIRTMILSAVENDVLQYDDAALLPLDELQLRLLIRGAQNTKASKEIEDKKNA